MTLKKDMKMWLRRMDMTAVDLINLACGALLLMLGVWGAAIVIWGAH